METGICFSRRSGFKREIKFRRKVQSSSKYGERCF